MCWNPLQLSHVHSVGRQPATNLIPGPHRSSTIGLPPLHPSFFIYVSPFLLIFLSLFLSIFHLIYTSPNSYLPIPANLCFYSTYLSPLSLHPLSSFPTCIPTPLHTSMIPFSLSFLPASLLSFLHLSYALNYADYYVRQTRTSLNLHLSINFPSVADGLYVLHAVLRRCVGRGQIQARLRDFVL